MTTATMTLWTHALAALLFGMLALTQLRRPGGGLPRVTFVVALAATDDGKSSEPGTTP